MFHETIITLCKSYLPERQDMASFLTLVNKWWTIASAKKRFVSNALGNAIRSKNGKMNFFSRICRMAGFLNQGCQTRGPRAACGRFQNS